nr:STAS domain-containing protein [Thiorhodococcus mannitoliphagus]
MVSSESGRWELSGALDFTTVTPLVKEGLGLLRRVPDRGRVEVDLSGVELANSAGLALLLEWLEMAQLRDIQIAYHHLPDSLRRIAAFSNLQDLLPTGH